MLRYTPPPPYACVRLVEDTVGIIISIGTVLPECRDVKPQSFSVISLFSFFQTKTTRLTSPSLCVIVLLYKSL